LRLRVVHRTTYRYAEPVTTSHHEVHLAPRDEPSQTCSSHLLTVTPRPPAVRERFDYFGNRTSYFGIHELHRSLEILAESEVHVRERPRSLLLDRTPWEIVRDTVARDRKREAVEAYGYVFHSPYVPAEPELHAFARPSFEPHRPMLEAMLDLTERIFKEFTFDTKATHVSTPLGEVMRERRGVCQDFAHVAIGCLRSIGLPARYVSGYLLTMPPPGTPRLVGADASHAWISSYLPNVGWVDFDPSNNLMPDEKHVVVAYGRDFGDVTPVRGVIVGGGRHALGVAVDVVPIDQEGLDRAQTATS
jgi:transglutaminase-like putative cysteine protease